MIDPSTQFGRTLLVFFWGGLAASIVNSLWVWLHFSPIHIAWLVVAVNMALVLVKNYLVPPK